MEKTCESCKKIFYVKISRYKARFCSRECFSKKLELTCLECGILFLRQKCEEKTAKYCSRTCKNKSMTRQIGYWKGKKRPEILNWVKPFKKGDNVGEEHFAWKGDSVGYDALHSWVERNLGKPDRCDKCLTEEKRVYHWANVSGLYKRDLTDWMRVCVPCHKKHDINNKTLRKYPYRKGVYA